VKGLALRTFEREGAAVTVDHVDDQLGVLPVFVLRLADVEGAATNLAEEDVASADGDLSRQVAVGGAVVAAAAGLVEHQRTVFLLEELDEFERRFGGNDFFNHVGLRARGVRRPGRVTRCKASLGNQKKPSFCSL
jgi:hypothetical protein